MRSLFEEVGIDKKYPDSTDMLTLREPQEVSNLPYFEYTHIESNQTYMIENKDISYCGCYPIVAFLTAQFSWILVQLRITFWSSMFTIFSCFLVYVITFAFVEHDADIKDFVCFFIALVCFTFGSLRADILSRVLFMIEYSRAKEELLSMMDQTDAKGQ